MALERWARPLRVGLIGATDRVRQRFESLFEGPGQGALVVVEPPAAEVLVVDLDGADAEAAWAQHRAQDPLTPAILVGLDRARLAGIPGAMVKPLAPDALLAALTAVGDERPTANRPHETTEVLNLGAQRRSAHHRQTAPAGTGVATSPPLPRSPVPREPLTERLDPRLLAGDVPAATELCGEGEDLDLDDPGQVGRLFLPTEDRFLGALLRATERFRAAAQGWTLQLPEGWVRMAPRGGAVHASLTANALREVCQAERASAEAQPLSPPLTTPQPSGTGASWESLEAFLWQVALWTYRGRLPSGTAVHGRVYLARWPNLTRLAEVPHGVRIAALWLAQPVSIAFTAQALGIRQRYAFALYGAAHAIDLAGQARRASDHLFQPGAFRSSAEGRVLSGVINRLRGLVAG